MPEVRGLRQWLRLGGIRGRKGIATPQRIVLHPSFEKAEKLVAGMVCKGALKPVQAGNFFHAGRTTEKPLVDDRHPALQSMVAKHFVFVGANIGVRNVRELKIWQRFANKLLGCFCKKVL